MFRSPCNWEPLVCKDMEAPSRPHLSNQSRLSLILGPIPYKYPAEYLNQNEPVNQDVVVCNGESVRNPIADSGVNGTDKSMVGDTLRQGYLLSLQLASDSYSYNYPFMLKLFSWYSFECIHKSFYRLMYPYVCMYNYLSKLYLYTYIINLQIYNL